MGSSSVACTNAWSKSMTQVSHPLIIEKINMKRIDCQDATGANVLNAPSCRSPLTQYRALNLLIVPSGNLFKRKTQVPGRIRDVALEMSSSTQVPFSTKPVISFTAEAFQFGSCSMSAIAWSNESVSGSEAAALYTRTAAAPTYEKNLTKCAANGVTGSIHVLRHGVNSERLKRAFHPFVSGS